MALDKNLVFLRKRNNMSQEQLAEILGVTRQAVSKWEAGQSAPDVEKLLQLSELFHVPVDQILKTLEEKELRKADNSALYTVLTFAALAILWFTGLILVVVNLFFNQSGTFQVYIWYESLLMMLCAFLAFVGMLVSRHIRKRKKNQN